MRSERTAQRGQAASREVPTHFRIRQPPSPISPIPASTRLDGSGTEPLVVTVGTPVVRPLPSVVPNWKITLVSVVPAAKPEKSRVKVGVPCRAWFKSSLHLKDG